MYESSNVYIYIYIYITQQQKERESEMDAKVLDFGGICDESLGLGPEIYTCFQILGLGPGIYTCFQIHGSWVTSPLPLFTLCLVLLLHLGPGSLDLGPQHLDVGTPEWSPSSWDPPFSRI
jgi:hypothetical protein